MWKNCESKHAEAQTVDNIFFSSGSLTRFKPYLMETNPTENMLLFF